MNNKIVVFCGAKGSGKSTSAELFKSLVKKVETKELAFAGRLKEVCSKVFNIEMKYFLEPSLKEVELENYINLNPENIKQVFELFEIQEYDYDKHIRPNMGRVFDTPRKLLQYVGTELLFPIDKLIHVNYALSKIDPNVVTLITDLRYVHEFDALSSRPEYLPVYVKNTKAELNAESDTHSSEKDYVKFKDRCLTLDNEGSIGDLVNNISKLIEERL